MPTTEYADAYIQEVEDGKDGLIVTLRIGREDPFKRLITNKDEDIRAAIKKGAKLHCGVNESMPPGQKIICFKLFSASGVSLTTQQI